MKLTDKDVQKTIKDIKNLNWAGYKLYLVGGILENKWNSKDIDICVTGKKVTPNLKLSMQKSFEISNCWIDIFYIGDNTPLPADKLIYSNAKPYNCAYITNKYKIPNKRTTYIKTLNGEWRDDGLFWCTPDYTIKQKLNRTYTKEPLLIYDGTV